MEYSPKLVQKHQSSHEQIAGAREARVSRVAIVAVVVALLAVVSAGWLFVQNRELQSKDEQHKKSIAQNEISNEEVAKKVATVYDAPAETPSVAKVADKSKLENQPFFQNAKQGDYLVIYPKAKIALIYRLAENKVVNIGPISTDQ